MNSPNFWHRSGLQDEDRDSCMCALQDRFPGCRVEEFREQGYCSYTLLITHPEDVDTTTHSEGDRRVKRTGKDTFIVQLRPASHALDLTIAQAATTIYSSLVPIIRPLALTLPGKLYAYEMERLYGTSFSCVQPHERLLNAETRAKLERLVISFADTFAQSWVLDSNLQKPSLARDTRADSPMIENLNMLPRCTGKVGSTILHRLQMLARELPDACLRERAGITLCAVQRISEHPVVLNHGDLIPSNILVHEQTWQITGLVDWAEAEFLPFGTCLYGLEHLLGFFTPASSDDDVPTFTYFDHAQPLRDLFWDRLAKALPNILSRGDDIRVMRDVGVLLWHGIAWDGGAIDRVVNERDDMEELVRLRAFLNPC